MRVITIGDVHGRNDWEDVIWKKDDKGRVVYCSIGKTFDKVIFLGDYVDSYDKTNNQILDNFEKIVELKKQYPDNVILLLGNHEASYFYDERCSGYRGDMHADINDILRKNIDFFQIAFQINNTIWTHAGIHKDWWEYYALPIIEEKIVKRYTPYLILCDTIADQLNLMQEFNEPILRMVGHDRGGVGKVGGPLWVDKKTLYRKPIEGYHQIVGHTVGRDIKTYEFGEGTEITFTDCQNEDFYYLEV